ncbi:MAG: diaminopimelate decarboxylase, partial [Bacteriovoracaceae bacterium]|nr:diaminopimelate decarboxylase [Bacteriovoracaceae bacterium]
MEQAISSIPTPFYLYSQEQLEKNIISFKDHADELDHEFLICYALKANSNLRLLQILERHNIGADIVSGGELEQALKAKIDNSKIIFSGVGKQDYEIEKALDSQVLSINIESIEELKSVNALARLKKKCAKIAFRYNPHVEVSTHKHISTGSNKHKFGMSRDDIIQALNDSELWSNCKLIGLSIHIGSQLMELSATAHAVSKLSKLADEIGIQLDFLDVGGGLGVDYDQNDSAPSIKDYMQTVQTHLVSSNFKRIIFEPGRRIMADAGVFISRVIRTKTTAGHNFLIVDGGMNDFA